MRSARTCSCAWRPCSKPSLAICRAPRRSWDKSSASTPTTPMRLPFSTVSTTSRATSRSSPACFAVASPSPTTRASSSSCTCVLAKCWPTSSTIPTRPSLATWRFSSTSRDRRKRWKRLNVSTSAPNAGKSCTAFTRRCSTSRPATRRCPTAMRAWRRSRPTCSVSGKSPSSCGAAFSICAGPIRRHCRPWPICTSRPRNGVS